MSVVNGGVLRMLGSAAKEKPFLCIAFTLYKFYALSIYQESLVFPWLSAEGYLPIPFWVGLLAVSAIVCLLVVANFRKTNVLFSKPGYLWVMAALMLVGALFMGVWMSGELDDATTNVALYFGGVIFLSVGTIGFHIELCRTFGYLGMRQTILYNMISLFFGIILIVLASFLSLPLKWAALAITPLIAVWSLKKQMKIISVSKIYDEERDAPLRIPYRFMTTSLLQGLCFGLACGVLFATQMTDFGVIESALCVLAAIVLVGFTTLFLKLDFDRLIYQIGFIILAVGIFIYPLSGNFGRAGVMLVFGGFFFLDLVLWALGSYLIKNGKQPATWVASCPTAALMIGRTLGALFASFGAENTVVVEFLPYIAGAFALVVVIAGLFLMNKNNLRSGWGFIQPTVYEESDLEQRTCSFLAQEYALTGKEAEILELVVQGLNRKDIAEQLVVSSNTVKTHIHSIYRKFDVHSEADLKVFINHNKKLFMSLEEEGEPILWKRGE